MVTTGYIRTKRPNPRAAPSGHGRFILIYPLYPWYNYNIYIWYVRHFSSVVPWLRHVGGVKCQLFLKHSNHWKRALKMFFKSNGCFQFPEDVCTSTVKESVRSRKWFTTSSHCLGVESAE